MKNYTLLVICVILTSQLLPLEAFTCADPAVYPRQTTLSCTSNVIQANQIPNFPVGSSQLTIRALYKVVATAACPFKDLYYDNFGLSISPSGGTEVPLLAVSKAHHNAYSTMYARTSSGTLAETSDGGQAGYTLAGNNQWTEVFITINLANRVFRALLLDDGITGGNWGNEQPIYSPSNAPFDATTKIYLFGGLRNTGNKNAGYIQYLQISSNYVSFTEYWSMYVLLGLSPTLRLNFKFVETPRFTLENSISNTTGGYLGSSSTQSTAQTPSWLINRRGLEFTDESQYFRITPFAYSTSPDNLQLTFSLTVSFWVYLTRAPSSIQYLFRHSSSGGVDQLYIKLNTYRGLTIGMGDISPSFELTLPLATWSLVTANFALIQQPSRGDNIANLFLYLDGVNNNVKFMGSPALSRAVTFNLAQDIIEVGHIQGKLADFRMYSPGSLVVNSPSWCVPAATSNACSLDLGMTNPPTCIKPATCDSSCSGCTSTSAQDCLQCGIGKTFYDGQCITCPTTGEFISSGDVCQACSTGCQTCIGTITYCESCKNNYWFNYNSCTRCADGTYSTGGTVSSCSPCSDNCKTCGDSATNCLSCDSGFRLQDHTCVVGSIADPNTPGDTAKEEEGGASPGLIVGITIGVIMLLVIGFLIYYFRSALMSLKICGKRRKIGPTNLGKMKAHN